MQAKQVIREEKRKRAHYPQPSRPGLSPQPDGSSSPRRSLQRPLHGAEHTANYTSGLQPPPNFPAIIENHVSEPSCEVHQLWPQKSFSTKGHEKNVKLSWENTEIKKKKIIFCKVSLFPRQQGSSAAGYGTGRMQPPLKRRKSKCHTQRYTREIPRCYKKTLKQ